jgi:carbonic anhydrase
MRVTRTFVVAAVLVLVAPARADEPKTAEGEKHWSYTTGITPSKWGEVSPTCAIGTHQSPVALSTKQAKAQAPPQPLEFSWSKSTGELVDTGHSDQVNLPPGNSITYGGTKFELLQFHFHTPSEHTIDGKAAPMEVHFVHKSPEGKLAVVGVMLKRGRRPRRSRRCSPHSLRPARRRASRSTSRRCSRRTGSTSPTPARSPRRPAARTCSGS